MKLLALDTSSIACSVALRIDDACAIRHEERPREHTRLLIPMIESVLEELGVGLRDLDAIVLGNGPGSFIGMRIAASVAQGLAFGASLRVVPVSSMAAVALRAVGEYGSAEVIVAQDAHMDEVYLGIYKTTADGLVEARIPERLHGLTAIEEIGATGKDKAVAAGYGWERYPKLLAANRHRVEPAPQILHPRAADLLPLGAAGLEEGKAIEPHEVTPAYLRQKVAQKPPAVS